MPSSTANFDSVHASLVKAGFTHADVYKALKQLVADQLLHNDDVAVHAAADKERRCLSPLQASRDHRLHPLLRQVKGELRRLADYDLDLNQSEPLDAYKLDKELRAAALDIEQRMNLKSQLFQLGLIEP
jgi:hypothetical protein